MDKRSVLFDNAGNSVIISDLSLGEMLECMSQLTAKGYINVDYKDVESILKDERSAIMVSSVGDGSDRMATAINTICKSALWEKYGMRSVDKMIIKLLCSRDSDSPVNANEIVELTKFTSKFPVSVNLKWGIGDDPALGSKVKLILLATLSQKRILAENN